VVGELPHDKAFWRYDVVVVKNPEELAAALREMPEETFR
jgi:hypothetical protein